MAKIEKMLISGIRSYPPDGNSVIEFQSPLTLIVGANGTGKTSIIESLKFITTGDLPPGTKATAFIHDPKIAREKEVKGQVKLRFFDITGNRINCIRSMVSTQKAKKLESKSIDGVITKQTPSGEVESISSRCTDFTKEMISRLGVSKAVLDNVIFCHQEDFTWPLSEGKVLKQKFDAIFAATRKMVDYHFEYDEIGGSCVSSEYKSCHKSLWNQRQIDTKNVFYRYIHALEAIRKVRKEQAIDVKSYNTDLNHLTQVKEKAQEITSDLNKAEGQVISAGDQIKTISDSIIPVQEQLQEIDNISQEVFRVEKKIETLKTKKEYLKKNIRELDGRIENKFEGPQEELHRIKSEFVENLEQGENTLNDLETLVRRVGIELSRLDEKKAVLIKENGKLLQEEEAHKALIQEKNRLIKKMANDYIIEGYEGSTFDPCKTDLFLKSVQDLFKRTVNEGKKSRENFSEQLDEIDKRIKNYEKSISSTEGAVEQKKRTVAGNNTKLSEINHKLSSLKGSENRLQQLERKLKDAETDLSTLQSETSVADLSDEITGLHSKKESEEKLLVELRHEENVMIQQSKSHAKIDFLKKDKTSKEEYIQNIFGRHEETLDQLFSTTPSIEELKESLCQFLREKQNEIRNKQRETDDVKTKLTGKESERKIIKSQMQEKESNLLLLKKQLEEVCVETEYNQFCEMVQEKVEQHSSAVIEISAFEKIYQKYLMQLKGKESQDKGCPLCRRKFPNQREVKALIEELNQKLHSVPEKREQNQIALKKEKELHQKLINLKPINSQIIMTEEELPKLVKKIEVLGKNIENEKSKLSSITEAKKLLEEKEKMARVIENDINRIDDYFYDLKDLERQINMESNKLQGTEPSRTMDTVHTEIQEKQELVNGYGKKIEQKRQKLINFQHQLTQHERYMNDLRSRKLQLQSELQHRTQLENQKLELQTSNHEYESEIRSAQKQVQPIKDKLKECKEEKRDLEDAREVSEDEIRSKLEKIRANGDELRKKIALIKCYMDAGKETALSDNKKQLQNVTENYKDKYKEREKKKSDIAKIQDNKSKQELRLREIDDNIDLLKTQKEIQQIDVEISQQEKDFAAFGNYDELMLKRSTLQQQLDKLRKSKAEIEGRKKGFEDEVRRCQRDLGSSMYADADVRHCNKLIELQTTELAGQDLDKYYKALDRAIMKFHGLKLAEINKIIKEYWIKTYQGNDIDNIEIVSEHDEEGSGASKARRSYNYRVCMHKRGTSLDMRGRCSAGQKVLASIIIRLALAETFCLNCGILALDEPTTNLDEANIKSLANSLRSVIELRMQQKNFQLIIITHDEDFVRALGRGAEYVEYYFMVYKDNTGNSKIHKKRMELRD